VLHHLAINGHRDVTDPNAQDKLQKSKKWMIYVQDREVRDYFGNFDILTLISFRRPENSFWRRFQHLLKFVCTPLYTKEY